LDGQTDLEIVKKNNQGLKRLNLSKEEWRRVYQFILMKGAQTEPLQANHQFTPDAIGFLLIFIIDQLIAASDMTILEMGSGTGNLAETILNNSQKEIDYLGLEIDDLLIDLSASIAEVMGSKAHFAQGDAVRPQVMKESDMVISDLPVGYYPDDQIASRYQVASQSKHTYAHHLLMEQALKYIKHDGYAIFLAPNNLLTSPQSDLLKDWMKASAQLKAMIALPESLFASVAQAKTIFVFQKQKKESIEPFIYALSDLNNVEEIAAFSESFQKWCKDSEN